MFGGVQGQEREGRIAGRVADTSSCRLCDYASWYRSVDRHSTPALRLHGVDPGAHAPDCRDVPGGGLVLISPDGSESEAELSSGVPRTGLAAVG